MKMSPTTIPSHIQCIIIIVIILVLQLFIVDENNPQTKIHLILKQNPVAAKCQFWLTHLTSYYSKNLVNPCNVTEVLVDGCKFVK